MSATLSITPEESHLFAFLLSCVESQRLAVTLRVVGGWVRDKLLGAASPPVRDVGGRPDVDVAIDTMMGTQFAEAISRHLKTRSLPVPTIGTIQPNPSQSKHLETVSMVLEGFEIQFVHLRVESYAEHSRIPTATPIGSPAEDAARRDFTINALYYNLHTREIEDWTGSGLRDLANRILVTPAAPLQTFLDDPMRVVRMIRFYCRWKEHRFEIDDRAIEAASNAAVHRALRYKVSRERVQIDLCKIMAGARPDLGVDMIRGLGLFQEIFLVGEAGQELFGGADPPLIRRLADEAAEIVEGVQRAVEGGRIGTTAVDSQTRAAVVHRETLFFAATLFPIARSFASLVPGGGHFETKTPDDHVSIVAKHALKLSRRAIARISALVAATQVVIRTIAEAGRFGPGRPLDDAAVLEVARQVIMRCGETWFGAIVLATVVTELEKEVPQPAHRAALLLENIQTRRIGDVWGQHALFNGTEICEMAEREPGTWLGDIIERQMDWIILHSQDLDREACRAWLMREIGESAKR